MGSARWIPSFPAIVERFRKNKINPWSHIVKLQSKIQSMNIDKIIGGNSVSEYVHLKTKEITMFLNNTLSIHRRIVGVAALIGLLMAGTGGSYGFQSQVQWSDKILFTVVDQARSAALKENADILAPRAFAKATERVNKAQSIYLKGERLSEVRKQLRLATIEFNKAATNARVAQAVLASMMQARFDAIRAEAPMFAKEKWDQAENKLKKAAQTLEDGTMKEARRSATEAERLFRESELLAIKENILSKTYGLLQEAERLKVKQDAPKTLKKAQDLANEAEKELRENREDTDVARNLARQARREARHAIYLATTIRIAKEKVLTWEDVLLASETPLKRVAQAMDVTLSFEEGINKATEEIVKKINSVKKENETQRSSLFDNRQTINLLMARNEELEAKLGDVEKEKSTAVQRLEALKRVREKYNQVEKMFTAEEALLFREGNNIRIRLTGLSFPSGKSAIDSKYYPFLGKVLKAVNLFPDATITVEGHTDSYGSDKQNWQLSYDRAEYVMLYIVENSEIDKSRIEVIAYGESRPIATNETEQGKAKNRRIAVVIHPKLEEGF